MNKDQIIKLLGKILGTIAIGAFSWLFMTVYNNSGAISKIADTKISEEAQWKAINKLRSFHMG